MCWKILKFCLRKSVFVKENLNYRLYGLRIRVNYDLKIASKDLHSGVHRNGQIKTLLPIVPVGVTKRNGAVYRARVTKSQTFTTKIFSHCV